MIYVELDGTCKIKLITYELVYVDNFGGGKSMDLIDLTDSDAKNASNIINRGRQRKATGWMKEHAKREPNMFPHWVPGFTP
jgi:hypothetical protein